MLVVPSPKFQSRLNESPVFGSVESELEKLHVRAVHAGVLITGTGGRLPGGSTIVSCCDVTPVRLFSSRTVKVTV